MDAESMTPPWNTESSPSSREASVSEEPDESEEIPFIDSSTRNLIGSLDRGCHIEGLFDERILAKVYYTANKYLPPGLLSGHNLRHPRKRLEAFPEYCPQDGPDAGKWVLREAEFWTCGFLAGTLYALLERATRFPERININTSWLYPRQRANDSPMYSQLKTLCEAWAEPLHGMSSRTDTHDIGFIVMPALRRDWELTGNPRSLESILRAARSLASRYVPGAHAIRSWDLLKKEDVEIVDMDENVICIIDSLCNLDLLYYAAAHSPADAELAEMATTHANTLLKTHLRPEKPPVIPEGDCYNGQEYSVHRAYPGPWYSTYHVAVLDPHTGQTKRQMTAQGYADDSTWARGQAWGILGYAQCYMAAKVDEFLHAACGLAEYFLHRLETAPACVQIVRTDGAIVRGPQRLFIGRYVPLWDFDAPIEDSAAPVRDSSAGVIAANGLLVLSQALAGRQENRLAARYREAAVRIVQDALDFAFAPSDKPGSEMYWYLKELATEPSYEALLKYGTANNNANARKRYANHGLVYGDYYLVEFGNRLLNMGLA